MNVLNDLQPQGMMRWFEALCAIPHGSRDTKRVSDFCVAFAKERGLRCVQDAHNNVVIYAPASAGYETHPTVILQGHLDMVCEKEPDCDIDFAVEGLRLAHDDTYIYAEGTTLGGDDGIAVAYGRSDRPASAARGRLHGRRGDRYARRGRNGYVRPERTRFAELRL